jgi:chromosomal replication initiator protein
LSELNPAELWGECLARASESLDPTAFSSWLEKSVIEDYENGRLTVRFPNNFVAGHAKVRFGELLGRIARDVSGMNELVLNFIGEPAGPVQDSQPRIMTSQQKAQGTGIDFLRPSYTFERFVAGPNNQLAYAGAQAVTHEGGTSSYNPLFIYGGVGLGKTHLIQAIAHRIRQDPYSRTYRYLSAELFLQQYVTALERGEVPLFRNRYLNVDFLLMDDIQFLKGKERTQEEFFHRFNEFYQNGKQIVITADRPPHELEDIEERLVSRFQSGLVADIKPPEYETRLAILHLLIKDEQLEVRDEVLDFIATSIRKNVRQLAGVVHRLAAHSRLTGAAINMDLVQKEISSSLGNIAHRLTAGSIASHVSQSFGVTPNQLKGKQRKREVLVPRQVAMYLMRELTSMSLQEIGLFFSGRDHSTVLNSIDRINHLLTVDTVLERKLSDLRRELNAF